jgi:hypothetical protein
MKNYTPTPTPKKSAGQTVFEYAVVIVVSAFIINLIKKFFEFLYKPFYYWSMSVEERANLHITKAKEKKAKRDKRMQTLKADERDPMVQYRLRYIEHPENYPDQKENEEYLKWYKEWREGKVEDPELRWAPEFYAGHNRVNSEFASYLFMQAVIAQGAIGQAKFLKTIREYYPELTPSFPEIMGDIRELRGIDEEARLHDELRKELVAMGVDEGMVQYVVDVDPSRIREAALCFKKCKEFGYSPATSSMIFKLGINPDSEGARFVKSLSEEALLPERVIIAVFKEEITKEDFVEIIKKLTRSIETFGTMFVFRRDQDGVSMYDDMMDEFLEQARAKKRDAKMETVLEKKAWEEK